MATTDVVFQGLYFAVGYTASVSVAGLDCGDYVVAESGTVTVPINSDPDKNFNGAYLSQFDVGPFDKTTYGDQTTRIDLANGSGGIITVYVPVIIGFTYPSWGAILRAVGEDQTKTTQGPALGKTRRAHWIAALLRNTQGVTFGTESGNWYSTTLTDKTGDPTHALLKNQLFSGVWAAPISDSDTFDSLLAWNVVRPYACSVVALNGFIETSER